MNLLLKLTRSRSITFINRYPFAKEHKQKKKDNKKEVKSYIPQPKVSEPEPQPIVQQHPVEKIKFNNNQYLNKLILANAMIAGALPFFSAVNAGIMLLNGGFLISQIGHELKKFLILISNNHLEQLVRFQKPHDYLKLVLVNFGFLMVSSILVSFDQYALTHSITFGWYGYNIFMKRIPEDYWIMVFPLLFIIIMGCFAGDIKKMVLPSKQDILLQYQEKQRRQLMNQQ